MSGDIEVGLCDMCYAQNVEVLRHYYHYDIDCECCGGDDHFEYIRYCDKCQPKPPRWIKAIVRPKPEYLWQPPITK